MDRFKRFLGKFALYFGAISFVAVVLSGIFAAIVQIQAVFGTSAALAMMFVIIGGGFSALIAWLNSETAD